VVLACGRGHAGTWAADTEAAACHCEDVDVGREVGAGVCVAVGLAEFGEELCDAECVCCFDGEGHVDCVWGEFDRFGERME
jgi:hypothetical protein